jgi:hypothetical protein
MITIRSFKPESEVALICLEVTLTTPRSVYTISSNGPMIDSGSSLGGELFGGISWPHSSYRLPEGLHIEQQIFLPHDGSAVAVSWARRDNEVVPARLVARPFFSGCGPRSYRDVGFDFEAEDNGGRLTWLPNVRGPKVIADTNGRYHDEEVRSLDCLCEQATACASSQDLITPGSFEFELSNRPSVLIISLERDGNAHRNQHIGVFLAGLMQENSPAEVSTWIAENARMRAQQLEVA